jgi:ABC-2 type transport system ATP-binding protein
VTDAIRARNLTKRYGDVTAVDRLDLTVEAGEVFGFLGHNGAGKSTTINMLLDFARPTTGHVEVFGHDARTESVAARKRMGVLPEGYGVYTGVTGRQHVRFAMESKGALDTDPMALLDRVGIADAADRPAGGYSKGMTQRLVLAMALVGEPDLLVLDEPTSGLDPAGARAMREIILAENDRGATVFFSSHILEQVEAVADRVGIMFEGELAAVDTIEGLRETAGGGTRLRVTLAESAPTYAEAVAGIHGVETARFDDDQLVVTCTDAAKPDVVVTLRDVGADVLGFTTEESSLEELFVEYTRGDA